MDKNGQNRGNKRVSQKPVKCATRCGRWLEEDIESIFCSAKICTFCSHREYMQGFWWRPYALEDGYTTITAEESIYE